MAVILKITISGVSSFSYTQGMSDILAPILAEVRNEADVFWCFSGLMSKTIFVTSPKDEDMEKNLVRWKLKLMALSTFIFFSLSSTHREKGYGV